MKLKKLIKKVKRGNVKKGMFIEFCYRYSCPRCGYSFRQIWPMERKNGGENFPRDPAKFAEWISARFPLMVKCCWCDGALVMKSISEKEYKGY